MESDLFDGAIAAVVVRDCLTDRVLYEQHADLLLRPASNAKLFTSAAAFLSLPRTYSMETTAGVLDSGRRVLRCSGGADPLLTVQDIQKLAEIAAPTIDSTLDTLYMDASLLNDNFYGSGWMWDDESDPFMPFLNAFSLEGNSIRISMKSPSKRGLPVEVSVFPSSNMITVENMLLSGRRTRIDVTKQPRSNNIVLRGTLAAGKRRTKTVSMWRPQDIVAEMLLDQLRQNGINVDSTVVVHSEGCGVPLALHSVGHDLKEVLAEMNKESDNLCAEMALRHLAVFRGAKSGVRDKDGLAAMTSVLARNGLDLDGLHLKDGSGISFYNLVTARCISDLLSMMSRHKDFQLYAATLAVGGRSGTLEGRMKDLSKGQMFWGKTGTISGVSALSGYAQAPQGRLVSVVMLMQNFAGKHKPYREVQDRIVRHCITYSAALKSVRKPQ